MSYRMRAAVFAGFCLIGGICGVIFYCVMFYEEMGEEYEDMRSKIEEQNEAAESGVPDMTGSRTGRVHAFDVRTGDCLTRQSLSTEVGVEDFEEVTLVPCSSAEAVARVTLLFTISRNGEWPGDEYFGEQAQVRCPGEVGELFSFSWPNRDSWNEGARTVICLGEVR